MNYINVSAELLQLAREPTNLNYGEILLLALIKGIDGNFFMSNEAIANMMCVSTRSIKRWITHLHQLGLIETYYENIKGRETRLIECQI